MDGSIWSDTLTGFREKVAGVAAVPAGVAVAAIMASLALALLTKVVEITRGRKMFAGDAQQAEVLIEAARRESTLLADLADEDIRVFHSYMKMPARERVGGAAMKEVIRVPMDAARAAVRGLDLCLDARTMGVTGLTAADLDAAVALLSGAVGVMLLSVESNLREIPADDAFIDEIKTELTSLRLLVQIR
jgi:formiminotetrahydrofolate cyclodeaminase